MLNLKSQVLNVTQNMTCWEIINSSFERTSKPDSILYESGFKAASYPWESQRETEACQQEVRTGTSFATNSSSIWASGLLATGKSISISVSLRCYFFMSSVSSAIILNTSVYLCTSVYFTWFLTVVWTMPSRKLRTPIWTALLWYSAFWLDITQCFVLQLSLPLWS